jgi:protocatechuate 3,4-dioxygenase beta subunit
MRRPLWLVLMVIAVAAARFAPAGTITGKVTDNSGAPVVGAAVLVRGTTFSTATDAQGRYTLRNVPAGTTRWKRPRLVLPVRRNRSL